MSFLLDALKKSEQERQDLLPNLQTQHVTPTKKPWPWHWIALLTFAILINISLFFWFSQDTTPSAPQPEVKKTNVVHTTSTAPIPTPPILKAEHKPTPLPLSHLQDAPVQIKEPIKAVTHTAPKTIKPVQVKPIQTNKNTPLTLSQLSSQQRKSIGHIDIAAHFFNDQKKDRIVMINGDTKHEGQWVHPELQIIAITSQGVLLQYHDLVFSMEAFQELKP